MRRWTSCFVLLGVLNGLSLFAAGSETHQATGVKVGDVTQTSAIVWARLTEHSERNEQGTKHRGKPDEVQLKDEEVDRLLHAVPGMAGRVRLRYGTHEKLAEATTTAWIDVSEKTDFSHKFKLHDLRPATTYHFAVETSANGSAHEPLTGSFRTAPAIDQAVPVTVAAMTCQAYHDTDHADGCHIYESMLEVSPDFSLHIGDIVYLDNDAPRATSVALARYHWQRMYGFPRVIEFHRNLPGYWLKDDHDVYANDCWPGQVRKEMLPLTFADGLRVNREQTPTPEKPYRTVRWGRCLQLWLVEGREFRSPNKMPDGPQKTIWGEEQKRWLMESVAASDADWKLLISPTPIVGPDRENKADNDSNRAFEHEGNEVRRWIQKEGQGKLFVICGDRHWQYHSVHPETGVHEFSCGAASNEHAGGSPGEDKEYHRFHRVKGGFLSVAVRPSGPTSQIEFRFHDVHGKPVYRYQP